MIKVTKEGITKFITKHDLQDYLNMGFKQEGHKPEPMIIKESDEKKVDTKKAEK